MDKGNTPLFHLIIFMMESMRIGGKTLAIINVVNTAKTNPVPPSSDSTLSALTIDSGTLTPVFDDALEYTADVANTVSTLNVTATMNDAKASIKINDTAAVSGTASEITLETGENTISIVVTAEDTTTTTYVIVVTKAE